MFEIEYEFREQDLVHFNELQFMKSDDIQQNIKKNRWIVPGVMGLIGSFYYFYYHDTNTSIYILALALLWSLLSPKIMMLDFSGRYSKAIPIKKKSICLALIP